MNLVIEDKVSKKQYTITGLNDLCTSALFYQFNVNLPEGLLDGQFDYALMDGDKVLATGILQVGSFEPTKTTYNKPNSGYTVYGG